MPRLHSLAAGFAALNVFLVLPMHPHPSGSTDRVTPGAVRIEAEARVSINLLDDRSIIRRVTREYETPIADGSGFTVTPDGAVVTATGVVQSSRDPRVYAANRVFAEYFKVKIPADYSRHKLDNADLNARLQRCYPPAEQDSTCLTTVTTQVTVFPYDTASAAEGLPARILQVGSSPSAPAVLRVTKGGEDETLPTVPLGTALGGKVESVDFMTLPERPSGGKGPVLTTAHLDPPGSGTFKRDESSKIDKALKGDGDGAAIIDDAKSEIVGLVTGGGDDPVIVTPVEDIRNALVAADVTPRRGPVDVVYETALASFHNKNYTNAIPVLQQVLKLRNTHAVAAGHLRVAQSKAGTAEDAGTKGQPTAPPKKSSAVSPWLWVTGGVVVVGLLIAVFVPVMLRRRRGHDDDPPPPGGDGMRASSWPPQQTEMLEYARPVDGAGFPYQAEAAAFPHQADAVGAPPPAVPYPRATEPVPVGGTQSMRFCTQCGMRLGHAHRFCGFCGHPVESS